MAEWHLSKNGVQQPVMSEADLLAAIESGQVTADDMVWKNTMNGWLRVAEVPMLATAVPGGVMPTTSGAAPLGVMSYQMPGTGPLMFTETAMQSLRKTKPWARFLGIFTIIIGLLCALGGFAAVASGAFTGNMRIVMAGVYLGISIMYIALGWSLNQYASKISRLLNYRREDNLEIAMEAQMKFWRRSGILVLVTIVLYFAAIAAMLLFRLA